MRRFCSLLTAAVVLVTACGEPAGPIEEEVKRQDFLSLRTPVISISLGRTEENLTFAQYAEGVEPEVLTASFVATQGEPSTLRVYYQDADPTDPPLLEFHVGPNSLLAYPDGTPVLPGQSVQIGVTLDPERYIFWFQPAGLKFSVADPARLRVNYEGADYDANGIIDFLDQVLQFRARIWRQDMDTEPWFQIPTLRLPLLDMLEGRVTHFTGFAMAS
jgi:hypothetical protein